MNIICIENNDFRNIISENYYFIFYLDNKVIDMI